MTGCIECPLACPVLAQSWSQTATDGAWYSTTALLSGRDRSQCLCVLRRSVSEPEIWRTGEWHPPPPTSSSLLVARVVMWSSTVIRSQCCWEKKSANMLDIGCTLNVPLRRARADVCRWITSLASGSSRWGRMRWHTPPPPPQIALKWCAMSVDRFSQR